MALCWWTWNAIGRSTMDQIAGYVRRARRFARYQEVCALHA
jgi:hypothetical protein